MQSKINSPKNQTSLFKRLAMWTSFVVITLVVALGIFEKTAHASLFSFIASLFTGQTASAQVEQATTSPNSQTIALLQAATNIDPNPEKVSEAIPIDVSGVLVADIAVSDTVTDDTAINTQISTYTVQSGDTISGVAKMFGVTTNTILWANNLTGKSVLKKDQVLIILPISGITYTVKKGDTVQGIANKYKADIGDILAYNDMTLSSKLSQGDTVIIPNAEIQVSVPTRIVYHGIVVKNNPAHDTNGPSYPGYYTRPITGGVRTQGLHGYNAVDLAAPKGTPIHAAAAGTVIVSRSGGWNGGYGSFIIISHSNGTQTLYAHLSKNIAAVGQHVGQGDTIALLGSTGESTGPHVHFEIRGAKNPF